MKRLRKPLFLTGITIASLVFIASGLFFTQASEPKDLKGGKRRTSDSIGAQSAAPAAAFTPGNLVIYRVGDGTNALSSAATAAFLDEYTPAGVFVQSIALPTAVNGANRRLTASGTATSEGFISRSTDGNYLVFAGYDAALGTASITTSTSATVNRVIGRVGVSGVVDTTTALTDAISGGNPRGVSSTNGTDLWLTGTSSGGGIRHALFGATTSTSLATTPTNLRAVGIFGGQLYVSTQSGAFRLATVGTGTPTTAGQTITNLPGLPTSTGSPYAFYFADLDAGVAGVDTLYYADDGGNVNKWSLVAGTWVAAGTAALGTVRGLTGSTSGSTVTLYLTNGSTFQTLTDPTGYNASMTATPVSLANAPANTAFRGIAFAPVASGPELQPPNVDMNGDGRTDFLIIRESAGGFGANMFERDVPRSMRDRMRLAAQRSEAAPLGGSSPLEWWGFNNTVSGGSKGTNVIFGESDDLPVSGDFDGDGRDDVAVWRPGLPDQAAFYWINSSDLTFDYTFFGQTGDNPAIVGDYDGDGRDDPATFRCPPTGSGAGQCYFFYAASTNNPNRLITWIPFGFGEAFDFFPYPGDFDGDGRHDFCFQAVDPSNPQQGVFWLAKNDGTYDVETIRWGYSTDFLIPGDYDGDGRSDFAVMRSELGRLTFYVLERDGGMYVRQWGLASDFAVPGDYDGDGRQDIAIYRWNAVDATFWVLPTNGGPIQIFTYGLRGDVPVANWYVQ
jgi:hypothetical protein